MQIDFPEEAESVVKSQAAAAGYHSVAEYVLSLVRQDKESRAFAESVASDPRIETLGLEGIESGPAIPLDMQSIRDEYGKRSGGSQ